MSKPLVSVLVPVYNGEPYLAECLDSILAQDFTDFELLISEDGSTDGSVALIERYAARDSRIRWWRNPKNLGLGGNFNACLNAARGEFIKFVLQDDKLLGPIALGRMVSALQADPAVSLVVSAAQLIDEESRLVRVRDRFQSSQVREGRDIIVECLDTDTNLIGEPSVVLFRKSQATRGFDERFKHCLDVDLWFHLLEQGRFAYLAEPLCAFRVHAAQQTQVNRRQGIARADWAALLAAYYARPWAKERVNRDAAFTKLYYLRKKPTEANAALRAELTALLPPGAYFCRWLRHRLMRPFSNLGRRFQGKPG